MGSQRTGPVLTRGALPPAYGAHAERMPTVITSATPSVRGSTDHGQNDRHALPKARHRMRDSHGLLQRSCEGLQCAVLLPIRCVSMPKKN